MKRTILLLTCALAALPAVADAQLKPQTPTGSMIPVKPKKLSPEDAGVVRKHFAQCVYRISRPRATALLQNADAVTVDMAGAKISDVLEDLRLEDCLGDQVRPDENELGFSMKPGSLRDMLAEEAYLAANRVAPTVSTTPPMPPLDLRYVSTGDELDRAKGLSALFDCAILKDPADADALLRAMPGSQREHDLAVAIAPAFGGCLEQGQNVKLNQASIRSFVAFGMWNRFARGVAVK